MPRRAIQIVAALLVAQAVLVLLFVVPGRKPEPHGVPIGVAGPAMAAEPVQRALAAREGAFEVHRYATAAEARVAIEEREVYGAVAPVERRLLVASAASPVVAQLIEQGAGRGLAVEDVAPLPEGDPRGAAVNLLFLPLMIACLPLAFLLGRMGMARGPLLGAVLAFAVLGGLLVTAIAGEAMGALPGPYLAEAGVAALIVAAVALPATGLNRLLGPAGVGVAALLFILIGNPGSGNASAPELLPGFWRVTGQLLPPGAGGQALKDVAFFDGHGAGGPLLVLGLWALAGAALILLSRRRAPDPEPAEPAEPRVAVPA